MSQTARKFTHISADYLAAENDGSWRHEHVGRVRPKAVTRHVAATKRWVTRCRANPTYASVPQLYRDIEFEDPTLSTGHESRREGGVDGVV